MSSLEEDLKRTRRHPLGSTPAALRHVLVHGAWGREASGSHAHLRCLRAYKKHVTGVWGHD
eukprot:1150969-Pelagomonas_calceolata.AAC.4